MLSEQLREVRVVHVVPEVPDIQLVAHESLLSKGVWILFLLSGILPKEAANPAQGVRSVRRELVAGGVATEIPFKSAIDEPNAYIIATSLRGALWILDLAE
jgi:hypothetical protein